MPHASGVVNPERFCALPSVFLTRGKIPADSSKIGWTKTPRLAGHTPLVLLRGFRGLTRFTR